MAKKKGKQRKVGQKNAASVDLSLPQNITQFGEQNPEDKKIYIAQSTYKEIHRFTKDKTENESGGVLLGNVVEEFGKKHLVIRAFIEAKYAEGTPTTLKFTHETWEHIHKEAEKKYPEYKILGWIHTHPNFGIFLSEYDKFIHKNFFSDENQVAYVVDPIQHIEGFYFWINDKLERCKGFFLFDKTGVKITATEESKEEEEAPRAVGSEKNSLLRNIISGILIATMLALSILCIGLHNRVNQLQEQQQRLIEDAQTSLYTLSMEISTLYGEIDVLNSRITELEAERAEPGTETPGETDPADSDGEQQTEPTDEDSDSDE